ncbi:MAG: S-layer homology domain-containing protein [Oscillospiraceae bacterium]|nr:S-layer homology domain-containing protein [Oscillospiraceae bacterium]
MLKKITALILTACFILGFSMVVNAAIVAEDTHLEVYAGGQVSDTFVTSDDAEGPLDFYFMANQEKLIYTDLGTGEIAGDTITYTARMDSNLTGETVTDTIPYGIWEGEGEPYSITTADVIVDILESNIKANNHTQNVPAGSTVTGQLTATGDLVNPTLGNLYFAVLDDILVEAMEGEEESPRGVLTIESDGTFSYTAHSTAELEDQFYFVAGDSMGGSNVGSILFKITSAVPTGAPTAMPTPAIPSFGYVDIVGSWVEPFADKEAYDKTFIGPQVASDYYFQPIAKMTRGDFIIQMNAALGLNPADYDTMQNPFEDARMPKYLENHAKAAYYNKVIDGVLEGGKKYLMADAYLTRAESVKMLGNIAKERGTATDISDVALTFTDTYSIPVWAVDSVKLMKKVGVIHGYDDNTFRPFETLDRAAATKILSTGKDYIGTLPTSIPAPTATPVPPAATPTAEPAPVATPS